MVRGLLTLLVTVVLAFQPDSLSAQTFKLDAFQLEESVGVQVSADAKASAILRPTADPAVIRLDVKIELPEGVNTYSQNPGPAKATKVTVKTPGLEAVEPDFVPDHPAKKSYDENFMAELEKYFGEVTFSRHYRVPAGTDLSALKVEGLVDLLVCTESSCNPKKLAFTATYDGTVRAEVIAPAPAPQEMPADPAPVSTDSTTSPLANGYVVTPVRGRGDNTSQDPVTLQFELSTSEARAGQTVLLAVTMTIDEKWQTYALTPAPNQLETPTSFKFTGLVNLKAVGDMTSRPEPVLHETEVGKALAHQGRVTWLQDFMAVEDGPVGVTGQIAYQICEEGTRCLPPNRVSFQLGSLHFAPERSVASAISQSYLNLTEEPAEIAFAIEDEWQLNSLAVALPFAFFVGVILNLMPCVLPVLAIKILSFVQQAGQSRARVLALNFSYTAGVVGLFLLLAAMAVFAGTAFGELFQNVYFNVVLICIVFAMSLSLLGVFEVPVPGLIPSANSHHEGLAGAFMTGVIATLLGTPCTAPFIAPAFAFLVKQPPATSFLFFGVMGLGMASPYVIAGFFPAIVNWLPKPGMWMVRFKQFSGFVLLATVIFLLYSLDQRLVIPILILLLGMALFLWMTGTLYDEVSPASTKWKVRGLATLLAAPAVYIGLNPILAPALRAFYPQSDAQVAVELPWEPFSEERMLELRQEGRPLLIDFTANWCAVCKTNEHIALNTEATSEFVKKHNVVTLVADYTQESPEIKKWLLKFGQDSVPLTIIFPKGADRKLIPLRGLYTQGTLLEHLERAVVDSGTPPSGKQTARNESGIPVSSTR